MKKWKKKSFVSLALSAVFAMALPLTAFAEETDNTEDSPNVTVNVTIDGLQCESSMATITKDSNGSYTITAPDGYCRYIWAGVDATGNKAEFIPTDDTTVTLALTSHQLAYNQDETSHWQECTNDGCSYTTSKVAHIDGGYRSDVSGHWRICADCGYITVAKTPHVYNLSSRWCIECNAPYSEHTHSFTWHSNADYHWLACSSCGLYENLSSYPYWDHNWYGYNYYGVHDYGDWTIVQYPTDYRLGLARHTCTTCGYTETITYRYGYEPYDRNFDYFQNQNGWKETKKGKLYYENGEKAIGWRTFKGERYYFDEDGYMVTGWEKIKGKWFYFDSAFGVMQTGWLKLGNAWYYLDPDSGEMYFDGEYTIDDATYRFYDWGGMVDTSWFHAPEGMKYYRGNGVLARNCWIEWNHQYYYVTSDGVMLTDAYTSDGYYVNVDGAWVH